MLDTDRTQKNFLNKCCNAALYCTVCWNFHKHVFLVKSLSQVLADDLWSKNKVKMQSFQCLIYLARYNSSKVPGFNAAFCCFSCPCVSLGFLLVLAFFSSVKIIHIYIYFISLTSHIWAQYVNLMRSLPQFEIKPTVCQITEVFSVMGKTSETSVMYVFSVRFSS